MSHDGLGGSSILSGGVERGLGVQAMASGMRERNQGIPLSSNAVSVVFAFRALASADAS